MIDSVLTRRTVAPCGRKTERKGAAAVRQRGFTLIEIMVAVAILSLGIVVIYETFFMFLAVYGHYASFFDTHEWINGRIWDAEEGLVRSHKIRLGEDSGTFEKNARRYTWNASIDPLDFERGLFAVTVDVSDTKITARPFRIGRVAYALR